MIGDPISIWLGRVALFSLAAIGASFVWWGAGEVVVRWVIPRSFQQRAYVPTRQGLKYIRLPWMFGMLALAGPLGIWRFPDVIRHNFTKRRWVREDGPVPPKTSPTPPPDLFDDERSEDESAELADYENRLLEEERSEDGPLEEAEAQAEIWADWEREG